MAPKFFGHSGNYESCNCPVLTICFFGALPRRPSYTRMTICCKPWHIYRRPHSDQALLLCVILSGRQDPLKGLGSFTPASPTQAPSPSLAMHHPPHTSPNTRALSLPPFLCHQPCHPRSPSPMPWQPVGTPPGNSAVWLTLYSFSIEPKLASGSRLSPSAYTYFTLPIDNTSSGFMMLLSELFLVLLFFSSFTPVPCEHVH